MLPKDITFGDIFDARCDAMMVLPDKAGGYEIIVDRRAFHVGVAIRHLTNVNRRLFEQRQRRMSARRKHYPQAAA